MGITDLLWVLAAETNGSKEGLICKLNSALDSLVHGAHQCDPQTLMQLSEFGQALLEDDITLPTKQPQDASSSQESSEGTLRNLYAERAESQSYQR